jgi:hypothetical protein
MITQPTPETPPNAKESHAIAPKRKAGRPPKRAGRRRVSLLASIDKEAFAEIHRRASLAGQTVNDWLTAQFDPCPDP